MSLISPSVALALGSVQSLASVPIVYTHGGTPLSITGVRGSTRLDSADDQGTIIRSRAGDWLIQSALLVAGSPAVAFLPAEGDTIACVNGGQTETYTVEPLGGDECFTRSDREGLVFRIHTRLTGLA